ncbi:MAG: metallophosphoesterase [Longimicrobiales bacterium]
MRQSLNALALMAPVILCLSEPATAQATEERLAEPTPVVGLVFEDRNANGRRDDGEPGLGGISVSDQVSVVTTDDSGRFDIAAEGYGLVFVSQPDGYWVNGPFWRAAETTNVEFGLTAVPSVSSFTFVHASDTHIDENSAPRVRRMREMVDSLAPAFVIITGDLVRDALRVSEGEARGYYELLEEELSQFTVPVFTVPGNHEKFGIERHLSLVSKEHSLYGNRMYRHYRGPNYFSFTYGGVHFLGLDSVDYDDLWYHGHVDEVQLEWIGADVAALDPDVPLVTFNHIPFISGAEARRGLSEDGAAPSVIEIDGQTHFRHTVYNQQDVLGPIQGRLEVALHGHIHMREVLKYQTQLGEQRLISAAAVVGPPAGDGAAYGPVSGITLHHVVDGRVDDGTFLPLESGPQG